MNATELAHLVSPDLSHEARSLYMLYLHPRIERGCTVFSLMELAAYLENRSQRFPVAADLENALGVMEELERSGFIRRTDPLQGFDGQELDFPLFASTLDKIPERPFPMTSKWRPGPSFRQACLICGLEDQEFSEHELRDFTAYWASKPEMRVQIAWERAFVQRLLKHREARTAPQRQYRSGKAARTGADGLPTAEPPRRAPFTADGAPQDLSDIAKLFGD